MAKFLKHWLDLIIYKCLKLFFFTWNVYGTTGLGTSLGHKSPRNFRDNLRTIPCSMYLYSGLVNVQSWPMQNTFASDSIRVYMKSSWSNSRLLYGIVPLASMLHSLHKTHKCIPNKSAPCSDSSQPGPQYPQNDASKRSYTASHDSSPLPSI